MAFGVRYPFLILFFNYCVKGLYCFVLRVGDEVAIHFSVTVESLCPIYLLTVCIGTF